MSKALGVFESGNPAAFAGAELVHFDPHLSGDLHPKIAKRWGGCWIVGDVPTVFEPTTRDEDGQVGSVVTGCIAHTGTDHCDGVVDEAGAAFIRRFQSTEKMAALGHDVALEEGEFVDLAAVLTVMA